MTNPKISFLIPYYNKGSTVAELLLQLTELTHHFASRGLSCEFVVCDDGSREADREALSAALQSSALRFVHEKHVKNQGKAAALASCARVAVGEVLVWLDADVAFPTCDVIGLVEKALAAGVAVVVADRSRAKNRGLSFFRRIFSQGFRFFAAVVLDLPVHDLQAGLKAFPGAWYRAHGWKSRGFGLDVEVLRQARRENIPISGYPVTEVSYEGESSVSVMPAARQLLLELLRPALWPMLLGLLLLGWQTAFFLQPNSIPGTYRIRGVVGGGGHHLEAYQRFHLFQSLTGHFPLASTDPAVPRQPEEFSDWLKSRGTTLIMEIHEAYRMGDVGKIELLNFDAWLRGAQARPTYLSANFLFFLSGLLVFFWGFWWQDQKSFALISVFLIGSSFFQLFETYVNENIFGLPISVFLWVFGLNSAVLMNPGKAKRRYLIFALVTGVLMGCVRQIRAESLPVLGVVLVVYALWDRPWRFRLALLAFCFAGFLFTDRLCVAHFERLFARSKTFVTEHGGHPYEGPRSRHHFLWHPLYCGLGDFGGTKGYVWNDFSAYGYALPRLRSRFGQPGLWSGFSPMYREDAPRFVDAHFMDEAYDRAGVYRQKLEDVPGYNEVIKEKILGDIRQDPAWFLGVIGRRILAILKLTNGVQLSTPWVRLDLGANYWGWLGLGGLIFALWRRQWAMAMLILAGFVLALPAFIVTTTSQMQRYSLAHLMTLAWGLSAWLDKRAQAKKLLTTSTTREISSSRM